MSMNGDKKRMVRDMFDSIAPRYDLLNHLLSLSIDRQWRGRTVKAVCACAPAEVLDMATGTGDLAIAIARKMPLTHVTGIDLSASMIEIGRQKAARNGLSDRIAMAEGDAEELPFADERFDAVTIGFGIRNFADHEAGLREARRVLRKGGRLYILEFSTPRGKIFGPAYRFYFHYILPHVGRLVSKDKEAYTYLPHSVDKFPDNVLFLRMMTECGFARCTARRFMRGIAYLYEGVKE